MINSTTLIRRLRVLLATAVVALAVAAPASAAPLDFIGKWGTFGTAPGSFKGPNGVATAPNGDVYVADTGGDRIQRFSPTGEFLGAWGSHGTAPGQFDYPRDLAVAADAA